MKHMPVQMIEVQSSNIESVGYAPERRELYVRFHQDGARVYKYVKVPKLVWTAFQQADSKRRFLQQYVIPYFEVMQITDHTLETAVGYRS